VRQLQAQTPWTGPTIITAAFARSIQPGVRPIASRQKIRLHAWEVLRPAASRDTTSSAGLSINVHPAMRPSLRAASTHRVRTPPLQWLPCFIARSRSRRECAVVALGAPSVHSRCIHGVGAIFQATTRIHRAPATRPPPRTRSRRTCRVRAMCINWCIHSRWIY